jgi:hypothetical protein
MRWWVHGITGKWVAGCNDGWVDDWVNGRVSE